MKAKRTVAAGLFLALVLVGGCGSQVQGVPSPPAKGDVVGNDVRRADPGPVATEELVAGLNGFGFDFLRLLAEDAPDENVVFSPFSIGMAFGMAEAGARGVTAEQIADVFDFPSTGEGLHKAFNALDRKLSDSGKSTLRLANRLFPRIGFPLREEFVQTLASHSGARLEHLDFAGDPEGSRKRINEWVAKRTENRIKEVVPAGAIDPGTVLALANALYLKAKWSVPFGKEATKPEPFMRLDGSTVDVPLMHNPELYARFLDEPGLDAVEIPYGRGELSMLVLVPAEGTFADFESALDGETVAGIDQRMQEGPVDLALPRWEHEFKVDLLPPLADLGLTALDDFSGVSPQESPFIDNAVHAADIEVDEKGTVAAAATVITMRVCACPPPPAPEIRADRPFLYLIRDTETGTILFAGRVLDPTA
jgi:serpin B